ncbi:MAG: sortase [Acetivibrionales bacterium]|jgi:sortase A
MRKISLFLLIIGILVGVTPIIGQIYNRYRENKLMDEWLNSIDAQGLEVLDETGPEEAYIMLREVFESENQETSGTTNEEAPDDPGNTPAETNSPETAGKPGKKASKQTVIGIIQIKKIKVKSPIVEGVSDSNLNAGIGHIPGTAMPGEPGNCALAGHRSYTFGKFFNRLDKLETGDEIIISTRKEDLVYEVDKIHMVTPDDTSVLEGSKDENAITLITCTPIYVASHRLIVKAGLKERVSREP